MARLSKAPGQAMSCHDYKAILIHTSPPNNKPCHLVGLVVLSIVLNLFGGVLS